MFFSWLRTQHFVAFHFVRNYSMHPSRVLCQFSKNYLFLICLKLDTTDRQTCSPSIWECVYCQKCVVANFCIFLPYINVCFIDLWSFLYRKLLREISAIKTEITNWFNNTMRNGAIKFVMKKKRGKCTR